MAGGERERDWLTRRAQFFRRTMTAEAARLADSEFRNRRMRSLGEARRPVSSNMGAVRTFLADMQVLIAARSFAQGGAVVLTAVKWGVARQKQQGEHGLGLCQGDWPAPLVAHPRLNWVKLSPGARPRGSHHAPAKRPCWGLPFRHWWGNAFRRSSTSRRPDLPSTPGAH
jgi:hypothetical protein